MNLKPLHDRVLVERVDQEDKTKGGIIIPDTAQEKPMEGKVLAAGSGARNENGQVVAFCSARSKNNLLSVSFRASPNHLCDFIPCVFNSFFGIPSLLIQTARIAENILPVFSHFFFNNLTSPRIRNYPRVGINSLGSEFHSSKFPHFLYLGF